MTKSAGNKARNEKLLFLGRQALITAANALVGFLLLRGLNIPDYAAYTIVFSILAIFNNITNVGITPAMSGIGGKVWNDKYELRALLNTALRLRKQLVIWFAPPLVVYCFWQLALTGLHWASVLGLVVLLLFCGWFQIHAAFFSIVLQLNKAVRSLQAVDLRFVLLKLAGIIALLLAGGGVTLITAWITLCFFFILSGNIRLAGQFLEPHDNTSAEYQGQINQIIRANFLRTVYWSLEGQISILLCSIFASTQSIAEIGALGRLSIYFTILQAFIINYPLPSLAKMQEKSAVLNQANRILLLTAGFTLPILTWSLVHPQSLLWFLGPNYSGLSHLLFYFLLANAIGQLAAVAYQVCAARAWIQLNRYYVQLALPVQIALIYFLDLSKLNSVILFIGLNNSFFLLFNLTMFYLSFNRYRSDGISA